jgi:hypothetical protein
MAMVVMAMVMAMATVTDMDIVIMMKNIHLITKNVDLKNNLSS